MVGSRVAFCFTPRHFVPDSKDASCIFDRESLNDLQHYESKEDTDVTAGGDRDLLHVE